MKGQYHGEGKLIYPNVFLPPCRAATTRRSGSTAKWFPASISSTITSISRRTIGNIASMMTVGFTRSTYMASSHPEPRSRPVKTSLITSPLALMILEMDTMNQSRASSTHTRGRSFVRPLRKRSNSSLRSADTCPRPWISTAARTESSRRCWKSKGRNDGVALSHQYRLGGLLSIGIHNCVPLLAICSAITLTCCKLHLY